MKAIANKYSAAKRIRLIVSLVLLIVVIAAGVSFAWFRNTIEVSGVNMQTGTFQYQFIGYHVDASSNDLNVDFAYSTQATESDSFNSETGEGYNPILQDGTLTAVTDHTSITNSIEEPGEIYYVIRKLDSSVDLDISLSLDAELDKLQEFSGSADSIEAIGGFYYSVVDITGTATSRSIIEEAINNSTVFTVDGEEKAERTEEYFPDIRNEYLTETLDDTNEYWCFRLCYGIKDNADTSAYAGKTINLSVNLCVAQKGGLEGDDSSAGQHYVRTLQQFKDALLVYKPNDTIIVQEDITYEGDLIINRPLKLHVVGSELTVKGNMRFNYASRGSFIVNTSLAGKISVLQMDDVDAGGNLYFDLPHSSMELIGQNSTEEGGADIVVQNVFSVDIDYDSGLIVTRSRICDTSERLKTIYLRNESTIDVYARTSVGTITVHNDGTSSTRPVRIHIVNKGSVEEINLVNMGYVAGAFPNPRIFIDNYGTIERDGTPTPIKLPIWSSKWYPDVDGSRDRSNTRIIHQQGAGFMSVGSTGHPFKSDGSGVTDRDDIEYTTKDSLVDKDPDATHVTVHYMDNDIFIQKDESGAVVSDGTTLQSIIEYYLPNGQADSEYRIAALDEIESLRIVCYGSYAMTEADYRFLATMTNLHTVDLSEAVSAANDAGDRVLPDNAFAGMSRLKYLTPSDLDNVWGANLFTGTQIDEIRLPSELEAMNAASLTGIKYLHVGNKAELVINTIPNYHTAFYLFCADENTRETFILTLENGEMHRFKEPIHVEPSEGKLNIICKIFLEAERHGDYFLNLYDNTCYITTYVGGTFDANRERDGYQYVDYLGNETWYEFDFKTFRIGNEIYEVAGYDDFAFYKKSIASWGDSKLEFSASLSAIGDYAFWNTSLPSEVDLGGCKTVGHGGVATNAGIDVLTGLRVESAGYAAFYKLTAVRHINTPRLIYSYGRLLARSTNIVRFDTGVMELAVGDVDHCANGADGDRITCWAGPAPWVHVVHTDNANPSLTSVIAYHSAYKARYVLVPDEYAKYYKTANVENIVNIGENTADDLVFVGDEDQPFGSYVYMPTENGEYELLVCFDQNGIDGGNGAYSVPAGVDAQGVALTTTSVRQLAYKYVTFNKVDTLTFDDSYEIIGASAFSSSLVYQHLDLNNVTTVQDSAFKNCPAVSVVGNEVTSVSPNGFAQSKNLVTVSMRNLGPAQRAFQSCTNLRMAAVGPVSGLDIFRGCTALEFVFVNVTDVAETPNPAYLLGKEASIDFTVISIGGAFTWEMSPNSPNKGAADPYKLITIEDGVDSIVFSDWTEESVTANGVASTLYFPGFMYAKQTDNASELSLLMSFDFEYVSADTYVLPDRLYRIDGAEEVTTILGNTVPQYTYADAEDVTDTGMHVTRIGDEAFKGLLNVTNVTFPHSLEHIGVSAFENCVFGDVVLNGKGSLTIGDRAFYGTTMTALTMSGTQSIGAQAFAEIQAPEISSVVQAVPVQLGDALTQIGENAFAGAHLSSVVSTHNAANNLELTIGSNAFLAISGVAGGDVSVDLAGAYVNVGEYAFSGARLSDVTMPNMRRISAYAFNQASISGTLDLSGYGNGITPTIMPYAFTGTSGTPVVIGTVLLGDGTQLKGDFGFSGGAAYGTSGQIEYMSAFRYCKIGTFDFNNSAQPEALSFYKCTFERIDLGTMTSFGVNVSGPANVNYALAANQSIDHPYLVSNTGARTDNLGHTRFIFRECNQFGEIDLANIEALGAYTFSGFGNTNATVTFLNAEKLNNLPQRALYRLAIYGDLVFGDDFTMVGEAISDCVIHGNVTFGDGLTVVNYGFMRTNIYGTVSFGTLKGSGHFFGNHNGHWNRKIDRVEFRSSCTAIPARMFAFVQIGEIDLANIKTIGSEAFVSATLSNIVNMDSVETIGASAFSLIAGKSNAPLPMNIGTGFDLSNVKTLGDKAFAGITYNDVFYDGPVLNYDINLSAVTSLGTAIFNGATINGNVSLGNMTEITANMFEGATVTGTVDFSRITLISSNAFLNATLSQSLVFDVSVTIAESAFNGATIPSVTFTGGGEIAAEAFANSTIGELWLGAVTNITGATLTEATGGYTVNAEDEIGAFHHATIDEIHIENAADPGYHSFAYATIGWLDYGNLTTTGYTSTQGWDQNGNQTPFYGVTSIGRISFGKLEKIGHLYFKNVEINSIDTIERVALLGMTSISNCVINSDMVFQSVVTLHPTSMSGNTINGDLRFVSGMRQAEEAALITGCTVHGDLFIEKFFDGFDANTRILQNCKIVGKFTINSGDIPAVIHGCSFLGELDLSNVTGFTASNGVFLEFCKFSTTSVDLRSATSLGYQSFAKASFPEGTVMYLDNATYLERRALLNCTGIQSIVAPKLTTVDQEAFANCTSLETLSLPSIVSFNRTRTSEKSPFLGCTSLRQVLLGENFTSCAGYVLFPGSCSALKQVILMANPVDSEGNLAISFAANFGLYNEAKLYVPHEYKSAYDTLLADGATLWGTVTADKLTTIEKVLYDQSGMAYLVNEIAGSKVEVIDVLDNGALLSGTSFAFPTTLYSSVENQDTAYTVASIGGQAMSRLVGVETVVLPETLERINFSGIDTPTSIQAYEISENNGAFKTVNGILYSKDGKTLVLYPVGATGEVTLDSGVTVIGEKAFAGCISITKINIGQQVIIADGAFARCIALQEIVFTAEDASIFLGRDILADCNDALVITVPAASLSAYLNSVYYDTLVSERIVAAS